ncbi:fumarylacetoacetate hydrolase family protein [Stappia sp. F7233]|uniref:Fumarylacetoacetate hydrolase family protein n=1 Tax=Stappia albiluteola TaxID=2758565 RepID=A0A839AA19_9HYPH|nr:fumarylacetoacetate hydrolase family protein [Stappia albiluteola]MBA5775878.1 fumarylacetoacetate hydrolase family protein [Stappia albiluteola]
MTETEQLARRILEALDTGRQIPCISDELVGFDQDAAYAVSHEVTRLRVARGEKPVGRKIGFTNRTIWEEYKVYAPIWGPVYDTTVAEAGKPQPLGHLLEPRIEPEIVLRLSATPEAGMDDEALFDCISHVAHGFEIVQSLFAGWKFRAADTIAAFALHGALTHGPFVEIASEARGDWMARLASFTITLKRDGMAMDKGRAENVLGGGPLAALAHLAKVLADRPGSPGLRPGEIISTGTLTRALPVSTGETWSTELHNLPLPDLTQAFI